MVVLVVVFAKLGSWQLARAKEKVEMLSASQTAAELAPLDNLDGGFSQSDLYRQVRLQGEFDYSRQFLLDNKILSGRAGYEVLTPFYVVSPSTAARQMILVNRGWLAASFDRTRPSLQQLSAGEAERSVSTVVLSGLVATPSRGFTLGEAVEPGTQRWPVLLQYIDYETIAAKLDRMDLLNAVIISSPNQPWNYDYNWQPVANGPEKHYGYAFQWFAMLLAVLVFFVYLNFIKKHE